jgi:hypothetical protein
MGFYSGTSTGPNDLIDKLRVACIAESFTIDDFSAVGAGYRLHVHKTLGGEVSYFNFRSAIAETGTTLITEDNGAGVNGTVTGLIMNGSTGYDAGALWHKQTGYPQNINLSNKSFGVVMSPMSTSAIPAYYFFFNGDSVHIVVEITAGKFQFMSFGMLVKQGAYTGGQYFTGSLSSWYPYYDYNNESGSVPRYFTVNYDTSRYRQHGAVYINADSVTSWRCAGSSYSSTESAQISFPCIDGRGGTSAKTGLASIFYWKSPSAYNAMAAMCPIYTVLRRSDGNYSLIGYPEGVRFLNVTNYDPAEEINYGDETWMVFHADSLSSTPLNMYCGFAFLKSV